MTMHKGYKTAHCRLVLVDPEDREYQAFVGDEYIGSVYKGWFRLGGAQWANTKVSYGFKTMRDALVNLRRIAGKL